MDLRLDGKTALITGSERGIGRAIALTYASAGADVIIASLSRDETATKNMKALAGEIEALGRKAMVAPVDVSNEQSVKNLAAETEKSFPAEYTRQTVPGEFYHIDQCSYPGRRADRRCCRSGSRRKMGSLSLVHCCRYIRNRAATCYILQ